MQGEGILIPMYRNEHDCSGLRDAMLSHRGGLWNTVSPAWQWAPLGARSYGVVCMVPPES